MKNPTKYRVAYELGGRGPLRQTLAEATRDARRASYSDPHDLQGVGFVAIDYPADGTDPWGVERVLTDAELAEMAEPSNVAQ